MDQSRAINALAPFLALAKSANSPRAAADLVTQATSVAHTYVFAELLQQPNIQSLAGHDQYGVFHTLLQIFAWDTWSTYKATPNLPALSSAQALKLRLLSLVTIASQRPASSTASNLSYESLCAMLGLDSPIDLEHLVTQAIYNGLITGTLNPASQMVVITSVAPMRDLAPGSVQAMIAELEAWSRRCDSVLAELECEIKRVKSDAERRARREAKAEKQIKAATEGSDKSGIGGSFTTSRTSHNTRGAQKREQEDDEDDEDLMDLDDGSKPAGGGRKKSAGSTGLLSRFGSRGSARG